MTPPRRIEKGQLCFITVRAVNRSFRFVPKRRVRELVWYCFAAMLEKFVGRVAAHEFLVMSNHYHLVASDLGACLPSFMEELNSLLSRTLNAMRGISGTNVEKGYNLCSVATDEKLIEHCVYTLANPCKAGLVDRSRHWESVSSLKLEYGETVQIRRPQLGLWAGKQEHAKRSKSKKSKRAKFSCRSKLPEVASFALVRPPVMPELSDAELRALIRRELDAKEREFMTQRKRTGRRVVGWDKVVLQHFLAIPGQGEEMFGTVPSFSASNQWARLEASQRRKGFLAAYYEALKRFILGDRTVSFPEGTWLMKRRYGLACCPLGT